MKREEVFCASFINHKLQNIKQTNTINMGQQLLTGDLSTLLALAFMSQPFPSCTPIRKSYGLSESDIRKKYKDVKVLPGIRKGEEIIEIRVPGKTLSFQLQNGLCIAAYSFNDSDDF